jgi:hypothetical protein
MVNQAAEEEAHAHYEEELGKDRAKHRRLYDLDLTVLERDKTDLSRVSTGTKRTQLGMFTYNQLDIVAKCSVHGSIQCLP